MEDFHVSRPHLRMLAVLLAPIAISKARLKIKTLSADYMLRFMIHLYCHDRIKTITLDQLNLRVIPLAS